MTLGLIKPSDITLENKFPESNTLLWPPLAWLFKRRMVLQRDPGLSPWNEGLKGFLELPANSLRMSPSTALDQKPEQNQY